MAVPSFEQQLSYAFPEELCSITVIILGIRICSVFPARATARNWFRRPVRQLAELCPLSIPLLLLRAIKDKSAQASFQLTGPDKQSLFIVVFRFDIGASFFKQQVSTTSAASRRRKNQWSNLALLSSNTLAQDHDQKKQRIYLLTGNYLHFILRQYWQYLFWI